MVAAEVISATCTPFSNFGSFTSMRDDGLPLGAEASFFHVHVRGAVDKKALQQKQDEFDRRVQELIRIMSDEHKSLEARIEDLKTESDVLKIQHAEESEVLKAQHAQVVQDFETKIQLLARENASLRERGDSTSLPVGVGSTVDRPAAIRRSSAPDKHIALWAFDAGPSDRGETNRSPSHVSFPALAGHPSVEKTASLSSPVGWWAGVQVSDLSRTMSAPLQQTIARSANSPVPLGLPRAQAFSAFVTPQRVPAKRGSSPVAFRSGSPSRPRSVLKANSPGSITFRVGNPVVTSPENAFGVVVPLVA